jgi:hypothetical protein
MPSGEFKHRYWFFADTLLALFENICFGEPIFTDFSNMGEDAQFN